MSQPVQAKPFNMSAACRDWYRKNPDASPKECATALRIEGIEVSDFIAQQVRYAMKRKRREAAHKAVSTRRAKTALPKILLSKDVLAEVHELQAAKTFARDIGGVHRARQLLAALEQLGI